MKLARTALGPALLVLFVSSLSAQMNWSRTAGVWWSARWRHCSVAFNNELWVMGGFDGNRESDVWHSPDGKAWTQTPVGTIWTARERFAATVYNNSIWVLGGYDGSFRRNDVWYSPDGTAWNQVTTPGRKWSARDRLAATVLNGRIWVMGGYDGANRKNDVWSSTDGGITWDSLAVTGSIWAPREHFALAAFNNELWVMGGWNGTTYYNDVWHSADGLTWYQATAAAGWGARYGLAGVAQGGKLWIAGGLEAGGDTFDVWSSVDGANWVQSLPVVAPIGRFNHTAVVLNGCIWVLGGGEQAGPRLNEVWSSPDGVAWTPSHWAARNSHRVLSALGSMWLMGGEDDGALLLSDVWTSPDGTRWTRVKDGAWPSRAQFGAVAFHNRLWVIGGGVLSDVYSAPDGAAWTPVTTTAPWSARDGFPVLSYHDTMWLFGGREVGTSAPRNDVWWSVDGANWTERTAVGSKWLARYYHTAVVFKDTMWVMGGTTGTTPLRDVWWSTDGAQWTQRTASAGWTARYLHASEAYDGRMWVLGGQDGSDRRDVWYSSDGATWTQATSGAEWTVRSALCAVTFSDRLWVLGGYNANSSANYQDVWRYIGPPGMPVLVAPDSGFVGVPVNGVLRWNAESRSVNYDIYLDTLNPPSALLAANQLNTLLPYSGLLGGRTYYWRVIGKNINGTTSSLVWNFTTMTGEPNWTPMPNLPQGAKFKAVRDGGTLAQGKEPGNDTPFVYAFKGNNRYEFYRYNTADNTWLALESITAYNRLMKKKSVKKGSSLVMAGDAKIYATKGNGTYDWWQYDPMKPWGTRWEQKADVPNGLKACREGVSSVAVREGGANYVYLLKGSGTYEFYRYNVAADFWETMAGALPGASTKPYKKGSCLVFDGADSIYCLKGTYGEFFVYSVAGRTWQTRDTLPRGYFRKKVGDGAGMAYASGSVYALKGNNTNEMWLFPTWTHAWSEGTSMTAGSRKVKSGGALVAVPDAFGLFAFRGNNTWEFWKYGPVSTDYPSAGGEHKSVQGQSAVPGLQFVLAMSPNPFRNATSISYTLPKSGDVSLRLYDVTGRWVSTLASGYHPAGTYSSQLTADGSQLSAGIYLLRYEAGEYRATEKLVIE